MHFEQVNVCVSFGYDKLSATCGDVYTLYNDRYENNDMVDDTRKQCDALQRTLNVDQNWNANCLLPSSHCKENF